MEEYEIIEGNGSNTEGTTEDKPEVDVEKLLGTNKKLYARLKEVEVEAKRVKELEVELETLKNLKKEEATTPAPKDSLSREEVILFAKGHTSDEVESLKKISTLEGIGLLEAEQSELFKALKESQEKKRQADDAELDVSRGSVKTPKKVTFNTPGLTDEQHRAMFERVMKK